MKHLKDFNNVNEGISAHEFTEHLVGSMQKYLPEDRFTVSYEHGEIKVTNDFDETGTYRMETFESNEGSFRAPNFPLKGSASEHVSTKIFAELNERKEKTYTEKEVILIAQEAASMGRMDFGPAEIKSWLKKKKKKYGI